MATLEMSVVRLCSGVPLDNTYINTITFANKSSQIAYFAGKTVVIQNNLSYQRDGLYIRWDGEYNTIINCNYLAYQNPQFSGKWFFAFITNIEYINDEVSYIYFEVDAYQTFMFDIEIKSSFVEREHVLNDAIGTHTLPEPVQLSEYVTQTTYKNYFESWWIVVGATVDLRESNFPDAGLTNVGGVYSGLGYFVYDNIPALQAILFDALPTAGKLDAVKSMYMVPKRFYNGSSGSKMSGSPPAPTQSTIAMPTNLDGYTPKNNKLLTAPYINLEISNLNGQATTLAFELFSSTITTEIFGSPFPGGVAICYPQNYAGVEKNYDMGVSIGNYPVMGWTGDDFANWLSQQQTARAFQSAGTALNAVGSILTNSGFDNTSTVNGLIQQKISWAGQDATKNMLPNTFRGNAGGEITRINNNTYGFEKKVKTIRAEYAKMIDSYFDRYGYNVLTTKIPNINGRPSWNFVKTVGANVIGKCPTPYINTIKAMLDRGVTFWHGDFVGDYTRNNKPLTNEVS